MSKIFWNALKLSPVLLGATLLVAGRAQAADVSAADLVPSQSATAVSNGTLQIAEQPAPIVISQNAPAETETQAAPATNDSLAQVTSVSQLSDVQPTDWAFQALQSLVERYGCIAGYPDGTYRGNRALTRYEFAAGLNACLDRVNELIATATADLVSKEDLATLQRLQEEFAAELATLRGRVDALEVRTAELEANQFSTTTKLTGEVVAAVSDAFGGNELADGDIGDDINTTFGARARLNFNTSFTGEDLLRVRLQAANFAAFDADATGTNMTRLGFDTDTENEFRLDDFFYRFRVGENFQAQVDFANVEFNDNVYTFNPAFESSGRGAISRFGRFNPIYRQGQGGAGLTLNFNPDGVIGASVGYLAPTADSPVDGTGLFDGSFAALGQISFRPSEAINIGLTYARSYDKGTGVGGVAESNPVSLLGGTGSALANQPFGNVPTAANHYGVEASFRASNRLTLSGWAGLTDAENKLTDADESATIFNYAVALALQDFGREGSQLGLIFGQPPKVTDSDIAGGEDADTSYHIEALYRLQLSDNVAITPGVLVILNPEHNDANDTIYVGTLRTTFTF